MTTLPSGIITYLFTDIEGSTRLWELHPDAMRTALGRHDEIITLEVESHNGTVVRSRGEGDSFFAVFTSAPDAAAAAYAIQLSLQLEDWPVPTQIRVRMALHTGESELRQGDYYGSVVNRCARLRGIAHGGQSLLSEETARLVEDHLPENAELKNLGIHNLRDLRETETVYQLVHPELPSDFPPLKSLQIQPQYGGGGLTEFVGRTSELAQLKMALGDALSGRCRIVMLAGEPGIGKTRTAGEIASLAEDQGASVVWGRCYEDQGVPPYWPWVQIIRALIRHTETEVLRLHLGDGVAEIAELAPELRSWFPELESSHQLEPEQARFRLFDSITAFLKNVSKSRPLCLILEDLHWADKSSLQLLEFMARETSDSRQLMLGTYRDVEVSRRHPLSQTLGALARDSASGRFTRVQLRGLSQEEVSQYIAASTELRPTSQVIRSVHARTEGNPLFLGEVIRLLEQDNGGNGIGLPEGIRDAIGRRLDRLSEACNFALTRASVIGREFDFRVLNAVIADVPEEELLDTIDEALEARLIDEIPGWGERYQFSHALIQQTLLEELSTSRRVRLHARIGEMLEDLYSEGIDAHAAELAHHFAEGESVLGPRKLVHYSALAGQQALDSYAWEDAITHFQNALAAKEGQKLDEETASILFSLARAQIAAFEFNQMPQAINNLERALDYFISVNNIPKVAEIAALPIPPFASIGRIENRLITRALEIVDEDSVDAGLLLQRYGLVLGRDDQDFDASQKAFDKALAIARQKNDRNLEMWTLANSVTVERFHDYDYERILGHCLEVMEIARELNDLNAELIGLSGASDVLINMGRLDEAKAHAASMLSQAEKLRSSVILQEANHRTIQVSFHTGDWQITREYCEKGLAIGPQDPRFIGRLARLDYETGNYDSGRMYLERLVNTMRLAEPGPTLYFVYMWAAYTIPVVAYISGVREGFDEAIEANQKAMSIRDTGGGAKMSRLGMALLSVIQDDIGAASEHYQSMLKDQGKFAWPGAMVDTFLGLLARTMGKQDTAVDHFDTASNFCRGGGYLPDLAWASYLYADTLVTLNAPNSPQNASSLIDESESIASRLGMRPLLERLDILRGKFESPPS